MSSTGAAVTLARHADPRSLPRRSAGRQRHRVRRSGRGNPDIYLIKDDSSNVRRLTSTGSIESTPEWSPNGRQISFTSGRSGSPQIYVMDAEGTNVRRISFDGEWNDDAVWSPTAKIAYTSRVNGRFQIRIATPSPASRIVAGEG
jgi:TolB protein